MKRPFSFMSVAALMRTLAEAGGDLEQQQREAVFWVHLHNSGGTSLRTLAEINLEVPIAPSSANWNRCAAVADSRLAA